MSLGGKVEEGKCTHCSPRLRVRLAHSRVFDGRAGEADEQRIRQGIPQVAGESVGPLAECVYFTGINGKRMSSAAFTNSGGSFAALPKYIGINNANRAP